MTKPIRSPLRAYVEFLDEGDTINLNGGPRMNREEALRMVEESEKMLAALLAADNEKARRCNRRAKPRKEAK